MNSRQFIVLIPNGPGAFSKKRFNDFLEADQAARDKNGQLYELEDGETDLDIDDDNNITGGKLISDYSS